MPNCFFNTKDKPLTVLKDVFERPVSITFSLMDVYLQIACRYNEVELVSQTLINEREALNLQWENYGIVRINVDYNIITFQFKLDFEDYLKSDEFKSFCRDMGSKEGVWLIKEIFDFFTPTDPLDYTDDDPGLVIGKRI